MNREEMIRKIWREEYMSEPKMTLEYMIYKLDDAVVIGDDETVGRMIKQVWPQLGTALRAAERINEMLNYVGIHEDESSSALEELAQARDEWDAATKGKK